MKKSLRVPSWLAFLALAFTLASVTAQDRLTPATLPAWQASGAAPVAEPGSGAITVPAGSQLVRIYPGDKVTVRLLSRPYFQAKPANWPALEVGPAALSFVQDGSGGGMVLLGDQTLTLPQTIALDADGRSVRQLDLSLAYDRAGNEATLALDGGSYNVTATAAGQELAVAVSAGGEAAWTLDILEVSSSAGAAEPDPKAAGASSGNNLRKAGSTESWDDPGQAARDQARQDALAGLAAGQEAQAGQALATVNPCPPGTVVWHLHAAGQYFDLALELARRGDQAGAMLGARLTIKEAEQAVELAGPGEAPLAASALELESLVQRRFLGDHAAAKASYRKALVLAPDNTAAKTGLDRLERSEAEASRKGRGPGG